MKEYSYTEKVDLMWEHFQSDLEAVERRERAKELGVHPSTLKAQEKHAPALIGQELEDAKKRWPRGKYVTSQMYSVLLAFDDEAERIQQARRHCYWLVQDKFIFYDQRKRAYTNVLEGDGLG